MKKNRVVTIAFLGMAAVTGAVNAPDGLADARGVNAIKNTHKIMAQSDSLNGSAPERNSFVHTVAEFDLRDPYKLGFGDKWSDSPVKSESTRDQGSDPDKGVRSADQMLDRTFDSMNDHSRGPDPWWGIRGEREPMLKDLHREPSVQ